MRYSILFLIIVCFSCQIKHDVPQINELDKNLQFKKVSESVQTEQLNVKTLSAGLYFLNVFAKDGKMAIKKIIIER